ncbi:solute carrier family 22 member 3-like isoform X1 [Dermacentor andersoni]|uniref:solute carrier family 22 member 3-like isoform X1 n=1 Tax=Dermacentor andersoni TaxID=34620 RepID=UPI003B3B02C5
MDICGVIGDYGKFQKNIFWFGLIRGTFMGFHLVVSSFIAPDIDHWCADPDHVASTGNATTMDSWSSSNQSRDSRYPEEGDGLGGSACLRRPTTVTGGRLVATEGAFVSCETWNYGNSFSGHTLVQEWDLVCERAWMRSLVQSSIMTGMLVGCFLCSALGDRLGRRPLLVGSCLLTNIAGLVTALAPSFGLFLAARVVLGISLAVMQTTSFCLLVEVTGPKHRTRAAVAFTLGFALSLFLLPATVWVLKHWRHIQVAITLPFIAMLVWSWYLPESPRWLVATDRMNEAAGVILRAASANGIEIQELDSTLRQLRKKILQENEEAERVRYLDLVRLPRVRRYSVILVYSWLNLYLELAASSTRCDVDHSRLPPRTGLRYSAETSYDSLVHHKTRLEIVRNTDLTAHCVLRCRVLRHPAVHDQPGRRPLRGLSARGSGRGAGRGPLLRHRALVPKAPGRARAVRRGSVLLARSGNHTAIPDVAPPGGRLCGQGTVRRRVHRHLAVRGGSVPHRTAHRGSRCLPRWHKGRLCSCAVSAGNEALHARVGAHDCPGGRLRPGGRPGSAASRDVPGGATGHSARDLGPEEEQKSQATPIGSGAGGLRESSRRKQRDRG